MDMEKSIQHERIKLYSSDVYNHAMYTMPNDSFMTCYVNNGETDEDTFCIVYMYDGFPVLLQAHNAVTLEPSIVKTANETGLHYFEFNDEGQNQRTEFLNKFETILSI